MEHSSPVDKITLAPVETDSCGTSGPNVTALVGQKLRLTAVEPKLLCIRLRFRAPCNSGHHRNFSVFRIALPWLDWIYSQPEVNLGNQWVFLGLPPIFVFAYLPLLWSYFFPSLLIVFMVFSWAPTHLTNILDFLLSAFLSDASSTEFITIICTCYNRTALRIWR